jgi:HlyD family secretion protein
MTSQDFPESLSSSLPNVDFNGSEKAKTQAESTQFGEKFEELEEFGPHANGKAQPHSPSNGLSNGSSNRSARRWLSGGRGLSVGLGLGVLLTLGAVKIATPTASADKPAETAKTTAATAQSVTVAAVSRSAITETITASGTVNATDLLPVAAATAGLKIQQVLVQEGEQVVAGQTLAILDNSVLQAQLSQAEASLRSAQSVIQQKQAALAQAQAVANNAQSDANRYEQLAAKGAVSQQDVEGYKTTALTEIAAVSVAQSDIDSARSTALSQAAQVQQLETQIGQTAVLAPASGLIAEKLASVGNVTGTDQLFSIIQDGALELDALVSADQLPRIRIGAPVRISADNNSRIQLVGSVQEISPLVNNQTRQATVKVTLPPSDQLRPGLFLKAAITTQSASGMTVPAKSVLPQPDGSSLVYVLVGNKVQAKTVQVGAMQADADDALGARIAVKSGLDVGDRVIVSGAGYLKDGDPVTVASEEPSEESSEEPSEKPSNNSSSGTPNAPKSSRPEPPAATTP